MVFGFSLRKLFLSRNQLTPRKVLVSDPDMNAWWRPEGSRFVNGHIDQSGGADQRTAGNHLGFIIALAAAPDGRRIYYADGGGLHSVHATGNYVAAGSFEGDVHLLDSAGKIIASARCHIEAVTGVMLDRSQGCLISASRDSAIQVL